MILASKFVINASSSSLFRIDVQIDSSQRNGTDGKCIGYMKAIFKKL